MLAVFAVLDFKIISRLPCKKNKILQFQLICGFQFLWSGLVDSIYWKRIGRRKTWLFPVQISIGLFLLFVSLGVESFLEHKRVWPLAAYFFILNFLVATQDIVVDGWALTLLSRKNAGAAANCNAAGQTLGAFFGYGFFMALYSADFCNKWFRVPLGNPARDVGMVTVSGTFTFWGGMFIIFTILIDAVFYRTYPLLYHKFGNMVFFR